MKEDFPPLKQFFIIKTSEGIKYKPREKNKKEIVDNII